MGKKKDKEKKFKKKSMEPGRRVATYSAIRLGVFNGYMEHVNCDKLTIPYYTKTGILKNLEYDDKTILQISLHNKYTLYDANERVVRPNAPKDESDFVTYDILLIDFIRDIGHNVFSKVDANLYPDVNVVLDDTAKPIFTVVDSTSKAKDPQKYSLIERVQSIAKIMRPDKDKVFCELWMDI
jgi:hypothetical protein